MWSYRLKKNIGYALISTACNPGDAVEVIHEGRPIAGALTGLPFL
jgi:aminomethyltransferase